MNSPGDAQRGIGAECQRVDEVVVHAPVDHIHAAQAGGGAHVDEVVVNHQVAPLHQLDAHLSRQKGVLEVGGVVDARREQHDVRIGAPSRRQRAQSGQQRLGVVIDGPHTRSCGKDPGKMRFITWRMVSM